jgi:hypothetical protein
LPKIHEKWVSIDFPLDTGASTTSPHPLDAVVRIGISPTHLIDATNWTRPEPHGGVGGSAIYFVVPAFYAFLQDDGQWHPLSGEIRIAQLTAGNTTLPSLLGWDILQQFRVVADWATRTVSLH